MYKEKDTIPVLNIMRQRMPHEIAALVIEQLGGLLILKEQGWVKEVFSEEEGFSQVSKIA